MTIEPCGKDLATAGGSRDRSDAIAREVFEREPPLNVPVRVPEHRRQEDVDVEGSRRRRPRDRRGRPARAAPVPVPAAAGRTTPSSSTPRAPTPIPRLFDEFDRFAAADAGREVKGELPPGFERDVPLLAARSGRRRRGRGRRVPAGLRATSRCSLQIPGVDVAARVGAEKGSALTDRERAILDERVACRPGVARDLRAGRGAVVAVQRDALPAAAAELDDDAARASSAALAERGRATQPPAQRRRLAGLDLRRSATDGGLAGRARLRGASTARSSAGRTARAPAGCWPASIRTSSSARLREAAGGAGRPEVPA